MNSIAIIPARGGSKRIPRKNIKDFFGKPIIAYSIEAAIGCKLFDEIMVSTDDAEIAEIARGLGATVPFFRSEKNSDDHATTADVILEVLEMYQRSFEFACCIYPTAPLLCAETLSRAFELMRTRSFSTVFPTVQYGFPIWRSLKIDPTTYRVSMNWPEHVNKRSQDLPEAYHDAGQFYWINVLAFMKERKLYGDNSGTIVLPEWQVQDIDNEVDWKTAELKYKQLRG